MAGRQNFEVDDANPLKRKETEGECSVEQPTGRQRSWEGATSSHKHDGIVLQLLRRETDPAGARAFNRCQPQEKFRRISLQHEYHVYDPMSEQLSWPLSLSTKIDEIVSAEGIVFARSDFGVCTAFSRDTNRHLCNLNLTWQERVRSMFYNKANQSIITASVYIGDQSHCLRCRSTSIESIRRGRPGAGTTLFENENLAQPGFVEFVGDNDVVITYDAAAGSYKVFDLHYQLLYSFPHDNVEDFKICPGILLIIYNREDEHIPLEMRSILTGEVLKSFKHQLVPNKRVEFIEQLNEILLVKQDGEDLQILDVYKEKLAQVPQAKFPSPHMLIRLNSSEHFLTVREQTATVWDLRGKAVASFGGCCEWFPRDRTANELFYITRNQELVLYVCKPRRVAHRGAPAGDSAAHISVNSVVTGECLARVCVPPDDPSMEPSCHRALDDVTAIFYDERRNEIYTGNKFGLVHVWGN